MRFLSENLKAFRKSKDYTQEEAAEALGVSAQSVSKWERGETCPDITLLPALANFYETSVDALIGMDRINDARHKNKIFTDGHALMRDGEYNKAASVYEKALKVFPNDEGIMTDLAMALTLAGGPENIARAASLCERALSGAAGGKVHHTARAALCFIYYKAGETQKAGFMAKNLPHARESRENVLAALDKKPDINEIDSYLKFIALGESGEQDIICVDFGRNMLPVVTEFELVGKIESLREELGAPHSGEGYKKLPVIRVRDNFSLPPDRVRVRYFADYIIDRDFSNAAGAADEIIAVLRGTVK